MSVPVLPMSAPTTAPRTGWIEERAQVPLIRLAALPRTHPEWSRLRERVIELLLPLADRHARRFANRGEALDDLIQVARLGLVKSVDGYDVSRGGFAGYAVPTIVGEIKRHFRDRAWSVRVPRRLQEAKLEISRATGALAQELGHTPTVSDLAESLGLTEREVREGMECANAYSALSLHTPTGQDGETELADLLGDTDPALDQVEDRTALRPLIARLPEREQRILALRFTGNLTQAQIAGKVGLSQMHVSRLLNHSLGQLRDWLESDADTRRH